MTKRYFVKDDIIKLKTYFHCGSWYYTKRYSWRRISITFSVSWILFKEIFISYSFVLGDLHPHILTYLELRESCREIWVFPSGHRDTGHLQHKPDCQDKHFTCAHKQSTQCTLVRFSLNLNVFTYFHFLFNNHHFFFFTTSKIVTIK